MRRIVFMWMAFLVGISGLYATESGRENVAKNVFRFIFSEGDEAYDNDYSDNAAEWKRLFAYYNTVRKETGTDGCYFLIESFVSNNVKNSDLFLLNQATFRANIIRSQLKLRLGLSSDRIAFCINRSGNGELTNRVRITLIRGAIPQTVNKDIFYSLSNSRQDISGALQRYPEIPYYDLYYYDEKVNTDVPAAPQEVISATVPTTEAAALPVNVRKPEEIKKPGSHPQAHPFNIGIKTDLIPWLGVVPAWELNGGGDSDYSKGALMYNGAVEYCFARRYSVEASFLYSYTSFGGRSDNLWGISRFALEPRYWFTGDNTFRGFNAGLALGYGDFDMQIGKPEKQGKTGRFYSAAFTLGYTLPVYRNFLVEGRLSLGYRNAYDGKEYRIDDNDRKNYYESGFSNGQWVVGVAFNLLFRTGFR